MTPLQILRHALKERGATLTLTWLEGPGYCIVVDDVTEAGEPGACVRVAPGVHNPRHIVTGRYPAHDR